MKKERIEIRVTIIEKKIIEKRASNCGLPVSEYLRKLALGHQPNYKLTLEEIDVYKLLHSIQRNFTNISNMYKGRNTSINEEVRYLINEVKTHLQKFQ